MPEQKTVYVAGYEPNPLGVLLMTAGAALGTYHGYRRNQSVGWAIAWGFLGTAFPIITTAVALAQGYGERKTG